MYMYFSIGNGHWPAHRTSTVPAVSAHFRSLYNLVNHAFEYWRYCSQWKNDAGPRSMDESSPQRKCTVTR